MAKPVQAYPVPTSNDVTVAWPEASGEACVLDAMGRQILCETVRETQTTWNTEAWAEGTYLVQWRSDAGRVVMTRISVVR